MRRMRNISRGVMVGLIAGSAVLAVPAYARGGGGFGGGGHGFAFGFRSPGFAFHGANSLAFRSRLFAHRFFGRPYFGQPYAALAPFGLGYGLGGYGYGGGGEFGPGLPIYDVPPYLGQGPIYGQGARPREPEQSPVETASMIAPAVPGAHPPPIPTVITPYEVRPGTMPTHERADSAPMPTVIAGR